MDHTSSRTARTLATKERASLLKGIAALETRLCAVKRKLGTSIGHATDVDAESLAALTVSSNARLAVRGRTIDEP